VLKEYKVYDRAVQGVRRDESTARAKRYKEPEVCRLYPKGEKARVYLPILDWTTEDVARFIGEQGIKCALVYYDADGIFHPERRLGCVGCPMKSDCGKADFLRYPKLLKAVIRAEQDYLDAHPDCRAKAKMGDAYGVVFQDLFCDSYEQFESRVRPDLFPEAAINPREYMSNYFGIEL
jgi:3'-phosphoadenosine 5'-phosphosulfate sulfotransferase (PAPS reductase)/FAD synthetase